jgi:hypothetical protein
LPPIEKPHIPQGQRHARVYHDQSRFVPTGQGKWTGHFETRVAVNDQRFKQGYGIAAEYTDGASLGHQRPQRGLVTISKREVSGHQPSQAQDDPKQANKISQHTRAAQKPANELRPLLTV